MGCSNEGIFEEGGEKGTYYDAVNAPHRVPILISETTRDSIIGVKSRPSGVSSWPKRVLKSLNSNMPEIWPVS